MSLAMFSRHNFIFKDCFRLLSVMSMGKIIVTLTDNLERKLRNTVKNKYGNKRGAMSIIVEEALKNYFEKEN